MIHSCIMAYTGIIFDKDGTLFDYYTVWAPVFRKTISGILQEFGRSDDAGLERELLEMLGIGSEAINPKGLIFAHNGTLMLMKLFVFSKRNRLPYKKLVKAFMNGYYDSQELIKASLLSNSDGTLLLPLFRKLKAHGYTIGIVTSDNAESTSICLEHFQIEPFIDMICTYDDHYKKKPNPQSFQAFCQRFSLQPEEVAVVGDAPVDMRYARRGKAGYIIGVMTGSKDIDNLSRLADIVYPTVHDLIDDQRIFGPSES